MPPPTLRRPRNKREQGPTRPPHGRELLRICGLAAVRALFECDPGRVERLFFEPAHQGELAAFCQVLARSRKPYRQVDAADLARVAGTMLHGGAVAIARPGPLSNFVSKTVSDWAQDGKPLLILDGVGNPHNLGAIARSAAFFGLDRLVLADRPDQALPSDAAYRVAEGGLEHLVVYRAQLPAALRELQGPYRVVGTSPGGGPPLVKRAVDHPIALILGNEGNRPRPCYTRRLRRGGGDPRQRPGAVAQCSERGGDPDLPDDPALRVLLEVRKLVNGGQ
jgi:TrmH RNA methyltransferase